MINVSFSSNGITFQRINKKPIQHKSIEATDGNTYQAKVPGSSKTIIEFTYTQKGVLTKNDMPEEIKNEFSEIEQEIILEKQKQAIQKNLTKNMLICTKQIDFLLNYKDFIVGGHEADALAKSTRELQSVIKKK